MARNIVALLDIYRDDLLTLLRRYCCRYMLLLLQQLIFILLHFISVNSGWRHGSSSQTINNVIFGHLKVHRSELTAKANQGMSGWPVVMGSPLCLVRQEIDRGTGLGFSID
ncbi:hypothetical protein Fot_14669 [Forsythia ovata]|uniref:Uncharacterized protein n=1 Tax=Forsythia ovata TaxID=205694 RepID=A0ABD1W7D4_9LAMI